ncbi:hypothetical protein [Streptomyces malaysiense]|uniref:hypothetical protein n=1 Tax=Streptomyces malaysiense TaxID=1428626 RepID=UPI0011603F69|nr:hypothetical protein [Streptomyces malaysiense]
MNKEASRKGVPQYTTKALFITLTIMAIIGGSTFLYFMKGLYLLPGKVCDGAANRGIAIRTLPHTRAADQWSDQGGTGRRFSFACRISTSSGSTLSGEVDLRDSSEAAWVDFYGRLAGKRVVRASKGDLEALAQVDGDSGSASVYVPCVPKNLKESGVPHTYGLVADVSVTGKSRSTGAGRRQDLTDFAYQLTEHAYKLANCKEPRNFPEELPRYKDGS